MRATEKREKKLALPDVARLARLGYPFDSTLA
jgi:hypothetical protein